ncbi:hypothetical protein ZIOFF_003353 [Zingiber officinale]|uniref:Uncharacterized protein n=1 Tax=Zingiber officinale TaxID=94328 RepID=A0A8J5HXL4_ZINOF|nr:hypothetical protein ZIOFF_003353 [Zingiber officinale]
MDNLFMEYSSEDMLMSRVEDSFGDQEPIPIDPSQTAQMGHIRDDIASHMWNDYVEHHPRLTSAAIAASLGVQRLDRASGRDPEAQDRGRRSFSGIRVSDTFQLGRSLMFYPLNLPSLRKEHERLDPTSSGSAANHGSPGLGSRTGSSVLGWSKPSIPPTPPSVPEKDGSIKGQAQLGRSAITSDGHADFPSLRATLSSVPKHRGIEAEVEVKTGNVGAVQSAKRYLIYVHCFREALMKLIEQGHRSRCYCHRLLPSALRSPPRDFFCFALTEVLHVRFISKAPAFVSAHDFHLPLFKIPFVRGLLLLREANAELGGDGGRAQRVAGTGAVHVLPIRRRGHGQLPRRAGVLCNGHIADFAVAYVDVVLCNGHGVDFAVTYVDVELWELALGDPDDSVEGKLMPKKKAGVFCVQATGLKCGGLILACKFDHRVADAYSANMFLVFWLELATSATPPTSLP